MTRHYSTPPSVAPFFLAPAACLGTEATLILGPALLACRGGEIVDSVYGPIARLKIRSRVVGQIRRYQGRILATSTLRTSVQEARSGRFGLNLAIGFFIAPQALLVQGRVICRAFDLLDDFLLQWVGLRLSEGGGERLVAALQQDEANLDELFGDVDTLLGAFESEFSTTSQERPGIQRRITFLFREARFLNNPRLKPTRTVDELRGYWRYVDRRLGPTLNVGGESGVPQPVQCGAPAERWLAAAEGVLRRHLATEEEVVAILKELRGELESGESEPAGVV